MYNSELIKFLLVIVFGFFLDIAICIIAISFFELSISIAVTFGFLVGASSNYFFNGRYVFKNFNKNIYKFMLYLFFMISIIIIRVFLINIFTLIFTNKLIYLSVLGASLITLIINYLVSKYLIFNQNTGQ